MAGVEVLEVVPAELVVLIIGTAEQGRRIAMVVDHGEEYVLLKLLQRDSPYGVVMDRIPKALWKRARCWQLASDYIDGAYE